jgi:hypothetical protein
LFPERYNDLGTQGWEFLAGKVAHEAEAGGVEREADDGPQFPESQPPQQQRPVAGVDALLIRLALSKIRGN